MNESRALTNQVRLVDAARTLRATATCIAPMFVRIVFHRIARAPSTSTAEGLARIAPALRRATEGLGVELEVLEATRVPRQGGIVFMWNQESHLDHFVLPAAIPRPFFSLYNNEVARTPFYGPFLRTTGHVHVDRKDERRWRMALADAGARVAGGECVLLSPEGTRTANGRLLPMKRGGFILATQSRRPIVCVTVVGGHERLPRGAVVVRPGKLRVVFSDPIETTGHHEESTELQVTVSRIFDETKRAHLALIGAG